MISKNLIQKIIREEINKLIESPGKARPPQSTTKILPKSDEDAHVDRKIYGESTLDLNVDGKPNNPKKFGASDIYKSAQEENKNKTSTDDTQDNTRFSSVDKFAKDVTKKIMSPGKKLMNLYNPIALAGSLGAGVKTESDIPKDIVEEVTRFKELIK